MDITPHDLEEQFRRVYVGYPVIRQMELWFGLPTYCLFAVGSRETNFDPVYLTQPGDNGHGFGWWQRDNRSHPIPPGYLANVSAQAFDAAHMLSDLIHRFGEEPAYDEYNSGRPVDSATTGKDYGPDTLERRQYLASRFPTNGEDDLFWGKDGADFPAQVTDARTSWCRFWWVLYHVNREPSIQQLESAVSWWATNGGDSTQAGIKDGRWGE